MGMHTYTFLGPYVECKYRPAKREVDAYGCANPECKEYAQRSQWSGTVSGFCSKCGAKKGQSKMMVDDRPDVIEILGGDNMLTYTHDAGAEPGDDSLYLIPNRNFKGQPKCLDIKSEDSCHIDLSGNAWTVASDIAWFEETFAKEIDKLKTAYDNVEVKWGFHRYYN